MFRLFDPGLGSLVGVILAGGGDRCLALLGGAPLIAHAIRRAGPQADHLIIAADAPSERFAALGLPVVEDTALGARGPLAGIHAGLAWASRNIPRVRGIVTLTGDAPFLPTDYAKRLGAGGPETIAVATRGGAVQPMFAYWPVTVLPRLAEVIGSGESRVKVVIESLKHHLVAFDDAEDPFFDPESPSDWATAERRLIAREA